MLHVHVDAAVHAVVLERADHLEAGAIAHMGEPRIAMAAEVPLQNPAVGGPIEHGTPRFELADAIGRLLGVDLGHPEVVQVLSAAHRVGEVDPPVVAIVDVGERGRHPALGHDRVGLAQQGFRDQATRAPWTDASMAARSPAPPAPMTRTSCSMTG